MLSVVAVQLSGFLLKLGRQAGSCVRPTSTCSHCLRKGGGGREVEFVLSHTLVTPPGERSESVPVIFRVNNKLHFYWPRFRYRGNHEALQIQHSVFLVTFRHKIRNMNNKNENNVIISALALLQNVPSESPGLHLSRLYLAESEGNHRSAAVNLDGPAPK